MSGAVDVGVWAGPPGAAVEGLAMRAWQVTHIDERGHRHRRIVLARTSAQAEDWMEWLYGAARYLATMALPRRLK